MGFVASVERFFLNGRLEAEREAADEEVSTRRLRKCLTETRFHWMAESVRLSPF